MSEEEFRDYDEELSVEGEEVEVHIVCVCVCICPHVCADILHTIIASSKYL